MSQNDPWRALQLASIMQQNLLGIGECDVIILAASLAIAVPAVALPEEKYIVCLLNHGYPPGAGASEERWQTAWNETLAQCRAVREAWSDYYFNRLRGSKPTEESDLRTAAKVERMLRDSEAYMYERVRHPAELGKSSHCGLGCP